MEKGSKPIGSSSRGVAVLVLACSSICSGLCVRGLEVGLGFSGGGGGGSRRQCYREERTREVGTGVSSLESGKGRTGRVYVRGRWTKERGVVRELKGTRKRGLEFKQMCVRGERQEEGMDTPDDRKHDSLSFRVRVRGRD